MLQTIDNVKTMSIKLLLLLAYDRRTGRQGEGGRVERDSGTKRKREREGR